MTEENKEQLRKWLRASVAARGTLLSSVRFPDQTFVNEGAEKDFPTDGLEQAWRVVSDTFEVLRVQRFPPNRLAWVYERAVLHCVRRTDGAMLGVFCRRKTSEVDSEALTRFLNDFQGLAPANPTLPSESK